MQQLKSKKQELLKQKQEIKKKRKILEAYNEMEQADLEAKGYEDDVVLDKEKMREHRQIMNYS